MSLMRLSVTQLASVLCFILSQRTRAELSPRLLTLTDTPPPHPSDTVAKGKGTPGATVSWAVPRGIEVREIDIEGEHYREYRIDQSIFVAKLRQTQPLKGPTPEIDSSHVYCAKDAKAAKLRTEASLPAHWKVFIETLRSDCQDMILMPERALRTYRIGIGTENPKTGATREGYYVPFLNTFGFSATW